MEEQIEKYKKLVQQRKEAVIRWQQKNRDRTREYQRNYNKTHKEQVIKTSSNYNNNNIDKYKQYQAEYRAKRRLLRELPFNTDNDNLTQ